jgi:hypothetical protein
LINLERAFQFFQGAGNPRCIGIFKRDFKSQI